MGFLSQFFQGAKIFLGVYCEKFLSTYDFLRASEYFRRGADGFLGEPRPISGLKFS
jgi:hypothetical protein